MSLEKTGKMALTNSNDLSNGASFADELYEEVNKVLGGTNPNQFLCLTIPGQALSKEDFAYDYKNSSAKGPTVERNESNLVNKMFDPCTITGADNGKTLAQQYKTALDMLSPKLNKKVADAKQLLRELLMTKYPYEINKDSEGQNAEVNTHTLQEVYFHLYDEYIKADKEWAELQSKKKLELKKKYVKDETSEAQNKKYNNAYLEWYETEAKSHLNDVNEKMSKLISVFTPNDMKILEGVLDSGSGAELQEARQTLENFKKITPSGGYVYPVKLIPTNWFELLNTNFTPIDLLKTPDAISTQIRALTLRKMKINSQIQSVCSIIPNEDEVKNARKAVTDAQDEMTKAENKLVDAYGEGIRAVFNAVMDIAPMFANGLPTDVVAKLVGETELKKGKELSDLAKELSDANGDLNKAQTAYVKATQGLSNTLANLAKTKALENLKSVLQPLTEELDEIEEKIAQLKLQLQLSLATRPASNEDGKVLDNNITQDAVVPASVPDGYTQLVITRSAESLNHTSKQGAHSSVHTGGVRFLFGGASWSSDSSDAFNSIMTEGSNIDIQIGMNVAKVGIERDWFNPGVFSLTKDMFNVTTQKISPEKEYNEMSKERFEDMSKTAFPCYPTAMVVARDVSIKFVSEKTISKEFSSSMEQHASTGGGFLFFSGSSSSSSSLSESGVSSSSTSNSITLKFTSPQIIGYYMEAVAPDKSLFIDQISDEEDVAGFVTIEQFVSSYCKLLKSLDKDEKEDEAI